MISNRNIICVASNWFYDPTSKHHVMNKLAERNHVIWVNYHGSRRPTFSRGDAGAIVGKIRQIIEGPRRVAENITVVTPLVVPLPGSRTIAAINERLLVRQIRSVLRDRSGLSPVGNRCQKVQLWSFAPDVDYLVGRFDEEAAIYYCVDDFSQFSGYDADAILASEARLAKKADLVITTSQSLLEGKRGLAKETVLVTHGVDFDHFSKARDPVTTVPADVAGLPRPILGFWGLIQDWVDVELLAGIARARPDWSIVMIGEAAADVSGLAELRNVHLLGRRPYDQLPAYARGMDAGLIPFRVNRLTTAVNPIKLREYLSAGLPVISTPLPEVLRYSQWVRTADGVEEWVRVIEQMLTSASPGAADARQAAMRTETWAEKVLEIEAHLDLVLSKRHLGVA